MGRRFPGIYQQPHGRWCIDKVVAGKRFRKAFDGDYTEAQDWLVKQLTRLKAARFGERPRFTFEDAACRYLQDDTKKPSLEDEILYLKLAMPHVGALYLDEICDETLEPMLAGFKSSGGDQATRRY